MTKEEREKQLSRCKWMFLYGLFVCFIVWILVSTTEVWHMRLDYADTGIKEELSDWNFYNLFPEYTTEEVEENESK